MAVKDSRFELQEISSEAEGSDSDSEWSDSEGDPDYDMLEETHSMLSNLSIKKKAKPRVVKGKEDLGTEKDPEVREITAPCLDQEDEDKFGKVQKIIEAGELGKLKVDECKLYLRKNGLRLTGNKDTLIQRIKEHLEIINGGGEKKYPPSSFVFNCKGDACTGDVVLFEQNVYEMFSIASRSASGPPCGKRIVAGRIVRESYGAAKQQHTFTIEVLWSKGEKPLPPLHPLLVKGRNLYRLKTLRQKWEDERERQKILMEKHSRGFVARADREARIQEKEKRKAIMEDRVSKRDSVRNRCQSHRTVSQYQPQESDISIKPEKPVLPSKNSDLSANTRKATPQVQMFGSSAIVQNPAAVTQQWGKSVDSGRVAMGPDQLGRSFDSGKTSFPVHHGRNHQALKCSADLRSTFNIDQTMRAEVNANYKYPDIHSREKQSTIEKYPYTSETNGFTEWTHHLIQEKHNFLLGRSFDSRKTSFHVHHGYNHQALKCSAYSRSTFDIDQTRRDEVNANYNYLDIHSREKQTTIEKYPWTYETNGFPQWTHHRKPLGNANHFLPMIPSRERYKPKRLCMHYARGRCYFGDNCKFSHDLREDIIPL